MLDIEAIELHKLITIVHENNGIVLDVNTDAVNCVFPFNLPFTLDEKNNITGYYYDEENYYLDIKWR